VYWRAPAEIFRGWARSASGYTAKGLAWIEEGTEDWRPTGAILAVPYYLALKAEALYLTHPTSEALEAICEAEALAERYEMGVHCSQLDRLRAPYGRHRHFQPQVRSTIRVNWSISRLRLHAQRLTETSKFTGRVT
jgi:hypothetical protein